MDDATIIDFCGRDTVKDPLTDLLRLRPTAGSGRYLYG
jgi:hypothetical protein